ncbi:Uncharacterised protein [Candidatus Burarchaeum australiense]|nr:Uncharacterised protein [Candidatus Burarchaeum australiense]
MAMVAGIRAEFREEVWGLYSRSLSSRNFAIETGKELTVEILTEKTEITAIKKVLAMVGGVADVVSSLGIELTREDAHLIAKEIVDAMKSAQNEVIEDLFSGKERSCIEETLQIARRTETMRREDRIRIEFELTDRSLDGKAQLKVGTAIGTFILVERQVLTELTNRPALALLLAPPGIFPSA